MKLKKTKRDIIESVKNYKAPRTRTRNENLNSKVQPVLSPANAQALASSARNKERVDKLIKEREKEDRDFIQATTKRTANKTPKTDALRKMKLVEDFVKDSFAGKYKINEDKSITVQVDKQDLKTLIESARKYNINYFIKKLNEGYDFTYKFDNTRTKTLAESPENYGARVTTLERDEKIIKELGHSALVRVGNTNKYIIRYAPGYFVNSFEADSEREAIKKFTSLDEEKKLKEAYGDMASATMADGTQVMASASTRGTKNYNYEDVTFKWRHGTGKGTYRWVNRPWQRFTFADALRNAMIEAGVEENFAKKIIVNSSSFEGAVNLFAKEFEDHGIANAHVNEVEENKETINRTDIKESKRMKDSYKNRKSRGLSEELKIITDISDYTPWSGAVSTWEKIEDAGLVSELEDFLEEVYPEGLRMVDLNDILWFDSDFVLEALGLVEEDEDEDNLEESRKRPKKLKESSEQKALQKSPYKDLIGKYFNHSFDFEFLDIVAETLDRIDFEEDLEEEVYSAVNDELSYISNQWTVAQFYVSSPEELGWDDIYAKFEEDISILVQQIVDDGILKEKVNKLTRPLTQKEKETRIKHLKKLHDSEPGDLTVSELKELENAGALDESKRFRESKQPLNEMIIDLILDRKDGLDYNARDFYNDVTQYGEVGFDVARALDSGTEKDVKKALCKYVKDNGYYSKEICNYINSVAWLPGEYLDEKGGAKKLGALSPKRSVINKKGLDESIRVKRLEEDCNYLKEHNFTPEVKGNKIVFNEDSLVGKHIEIVKNILTESNSGKTSIYSVINKDLDTVESFNTIEEVTSYIDNYQTDKLFAIRFKL